MSIITTTLLMLSLLIVISAATTTTLTHQQQQQQQELNDDNMILLEEDTTTKVILPANQRQIQQYILVNFTNTPPSSPQEMLYIQLEACSSSKPITMVIGLNYIPSLTNYNNTLHTTVSNQREMQQYLTTSIPYTSSMIVYIGLLNNDTHLPASISLTATLNQVKKSLVDAQFSQLYVTLSQVNYDDNSGDLTTRMKSNLYNQQSSKIQIKLQWHLPNNYSNPDHLRYRIVYSLPSMKSQETSNLCQISSICGIETCGIALTTRTRATHSDLPAGYQQFVYNSTTKYYEQIFQIPDTELIFDARDLMFNIAVRDVSVVNAYGIYKIFNSEQSMIGRYIFIAILIALPIIVILCVTLFMLSCYCVTSWKKHRGYYNVVY